MVEYNNLSCLSVKIETGIAWLTMNHPPINLLDGDLASELESAIGSLENDQSVRVVVLQSALPDFFCAHSGLTRVAAAPKSVSATPNFRQTQMPMRNMPKVTIAKVEGRARGGGNEIVLGADMCFAADKAISGSLKLVSASSRAEARPKDSQALWVDHALSKYCSEATIFPQRRQSSLVGSIEL